METAQSEQRNVVDDLRAMMAEHERQNAKLGRVLTDPRITTAELLHSIMDAVPGGSWRA